jgi:exodeoxyribonuclease V alpha subunit
MPDSPDNKPHAATDNRQQSLADLTGMRGLAQEPTVLEGIVEDIIFRNESNGYSVVTMSGPEERIAVGILPYLSPGESVRMYGIWTDHPDYGRQYQVDRYELVAPHTREAILDYLCSGLIKGIGERTAQRLVKQFGDETLEILRVHPEKVAMLKGIGAAKAAKIAEQLQEKKDFQDLVLLLRPLGIGTGKILRIYQQYGREAMQLISENPFRLADEIYGIGFLTADKLARDLGLDPQSPGRVACALRYVLSQAISGGHTYLPIDQLLTGASQLLDLPLTDRHPALAGLEADSQIVLLGRQFGDPEDRRAALGILVTVEKLAAERLVSLLKTAPSRFPELAIPTYAAEIIRGSCASQQMELAPEQESALLEALRQPVLIMTGGPGTGKTTIIKLLCDCLESRGGRVLLAAPTGRAARRMTEATGVEAKTLHRLLEIQFSPDDSRQGYSRRPVSVAKLDCDLLIVDEASMIDVFLFKILIDSVSPGTRLVLVGDADQLPSVGPGYVLKDLIDSQRIPVARLTRIFRQSSQSLIIRNAHRIHDGLWPELDQSRDSHFLFVAKEKAEEVAAATLRLCSEILPLQYNCDPLRDVQVLTPSHKGPAGTVMLNRQLQDALRLRTGSLVAGKPQPVEDETIEAHGCRFGVGDKVMQNRNNYDLSWRLQADPETTGSGVFNGETGTVSYVDAESGCLEALFDDDRLITYDRQNLEDLELAYAITIHKSQGSEYPVVVLAIPAGAPRLLTRNLLYTAVTRARQKLLLVTSRRTLAAMLANNQAYTRYTLLKDWLQLQGT